MRPRAILIEKNPHLREQLAETLRRLGIHLAAAHEALPSTWRDDIALLRPELIVVPMKHLHAARWRLVRELHTLPARPLLLALAPVDLPTIRQSALENGVDYVFDPLLELDGLLGTLREFVTANRLAAS